MSPADLRALAFHARGRRISDVRLGHNLGWSFTPLDGKRPIAKGWATAPRETLEQALAWAEAGNVGLRTGSASNGIVVIDADPDANVKALDLPRTVVAITGRGRHYYFQHNGPIGNSASKLGPHIDVKADRGQVVFPGSIHPDTGHEYTWAEGCDLARTPVAPLPRHILAMLTRVEPAQPTPTTPASRTSTPRTTARGDRYATRAMQLELHAVETSREGNRNDTLNKAAFSLGQLIAAGRLDKTEVAVALATVARSVGLSEAEIESTVASGLIAGAKSPRLLETDRADARQPHPPDSEYILLPGPHKTSEDQYIEQGTVDFAAKTLARLPKNTLYRRDFIAGEIVGAPGKQKWIELDTDRMRLTIDTHAKLGKWVTHKQTQEQRLIYQACTQDAAGLVVAYATNAPSVRELHLMVSYPVYGPGFVRVEPGWHDGLYFDEPDELRDLNAETDPECIRATLEDLIVDFPFKAEADRQNFIGLLLTPLVAPAIDGNRPMHLLNAPLERTGKSKLVNEVFGGVITGRDTPSMQITDREDEREKRILALLFQGDTLVHFDNLPAFVNSPSLASLLTTERFIGRLLGYSRNVSLPNHLTIVGTGNNVQASGEITKRIVPIMIEPHSATPETRTDFKHPDIRAYVRSRRRHVLACLLGMIELWRAAGMPTHPDRLGGFERWSEVVGGILRANGLAKWRTNERAWRRAANPHGEDMEALVTSWYERWGLAPVAPRDLRDLAEREGLFESYWARSSAAGAIVAFGRMLTRLANRPVAGWVVRRGGGAKHTKYQLEPIISDATGGIGGIRGNSF